LRNNHLTLTAELMDVIFAATAEVRKMFGALQQSQQPAAAPGEVLQALKDVLEQAVAAQRAKPAPASPPGPCPPTVPAAADNVDWNAL
jgi:two-component system chemotaxis sensor kinase CheA